MAAVVHQDAVSTTVGSSDSEDNLSNCEGDVITSCLQSKSGKVNDAVMQYGRYFSKQVLAKDMFRIGECLPWKEDVCRQQRPSPDAEVKAAFAKELESPITRAIQVEAPPPVAQQRRKHYRFKDVVSNSEFQEEDSDGEILNICQQCFLPLGKLRYRTDNGTCIGYGFHSECAAQVSAAHIEEKSAETEGMDRKEKKDHREAYSIGWNVKHIPRNTTAASKLATHEVPQGMMCLVLDESSRSVNIASTLLPSAAINLEYLSTALQVRRKEGHEPIFSLEPVDPAEEVDKDSMQTKVFEPWWLAGTAVGEVLFQADYHLKELALGEHEQPVVGMRSCFDLSDVDVPRAWAAREWFLVRKAEMHITGSNALVPYVKMGVEAREQIVEGNRLIDKIMTLPDNPMVRFAESFTRNFDLIAERRSVIYHLRELAKASVVAKFLLDSKVQLEESWFRLSSTADIPCSLEVPQLWKHKVRGSVLEEGSTQRTRAHLHSVYGGVNFGLNRFQLSGRLSRVPSVPAQATMSTQAKSFTPRSAVAASLSATSVAKGRLSAQLDMPSLRQASTPVALSGDIVPVRAASLSGITDLRKAAPDLSRLTGLVPSKAVLPTKGLLPAKPQGVLPKGLKTLGGTLDLKVPSALLRGTPLSSALVATSGRAPPGMIDPSMLQRAFRPPSASVSAVSAPRLAPGILNAALGSPRLSAQLSPPVFAASAMPLIQGLATMPGPERLQDVQPEGVDLRLDSFDLSHATRLSEDDHGSLGTDVKPLDESVAIGDAFWSSLEDDANKLFDIEDRELLRKIFNPALSDRRAEGELFCPPDVSQCYVSKLRALVNEEESLRQQRRNAFLSEKFKVSSPGQVFPASWTPSVRALANGEPIRSLDNQHELQARPEFKELAAELLETMLKTTSPIFDRSTEEDCRFRIYRVGSLEVRTVKEPASPEIVGAVFSLRRPTLPLKKKESSQCPHDGVLETDKIVKAAQYVEHVYDAEGTPSSRRRYYLVVETESGHKISTERLKDGTVTWNEDPAGLEERNSLARALHIAECRPGAIVKDLKSYQSVVAGGAAESGSASPSHCKRYVRSALARVSCA
mmetsp:Transcript_47162/g.74540  ORF Transcript_47162/g.74540 Transcript_47162/m.74540 type:complete len:1086 (-) Transcript_47162:73-3330(-)